MDWFYVKMKVKTIRDKYLIYPFFLILYIPYKLYKLIIKFFKTIIYGIYFVGYFFPITIRYFGIEEGLKLIPYLTKMVLTDLYNWITRKKARGADSDG